jgi:hypothetical protein
MHSDYNDLLSHNSIDQSASRVHCNIAFGELVTNFPEGDITESIDTIMPVLVDVLRDVPFIDFDPCLSWEGEMTSRCLVCYRLTFLNRVGTS